MNYNKIPIVHISVEHMRDQITSAIAFHEHQINDEVAQAVKQAVDNFDFVAEIRKHAHAAIQQATQECVQNYFTYGNGYKAIKQVVREAIDKMDSLDERI